MLTIFLLMLMAVSHASILTVPQPVIAAGGFGNYIVLLPDNTVIRNDVSSEMLYHQPGAKFTAMRVTQTSEAQLKEWYPGAIVSLERQIVVDPASVERSVSATAVPWNLDRIDERELSQMDGTWTGPPTGGSGVPIYIVDSGVDAGHPDFGGRVIQQFTTYPTHIDTCGHGSHVAGIAAGFTHGVARGAPIRAIKVLDGAGCSGSTADLVSGLLYLLSLPANQRGVINLSLGFSGYDSVIGTLIANLLNAGYLIAAAAGNDAASACNHFPSSYPGVLSVGATTQYDSAASYSNYGVCVDVFAPGTGVESVASNTQGYTVKSGTSMASPHVAGVLALLRQANPQSGTTELLQLATSGQLTNLNGSPNLLVYWSPSPQTLPSPAPIAASPPPHFNYVGTSNGCLYRVSVALLCTCVAAVNVFF